jgi:hypothetical protein
MKKWMMFLLCGMLVLCAVGAPSLAQSIEGNLIDFNQFTDEEMKTLNQQLQSALVTRGIAGTAALLTGRYVGGQNIPVGNYILICKTDENHYGIVLLAAADDDLDNEYPSKLYEFVGTETQETYYIEVEEGSILDVPFPVQLQIHPGIVFQ